MGVLCLAATVRAAGSRADGVAVAPARSGELVAHPLLTEAGADALAELAALGYRDSEEMVARLTWGSALTGTAVTSDVEGCGTNATRVFWAYYWEDEHRDDGDDSDLARTE